MFSSSSSGAGGAAGDVNSETLARFNHMMIPVHAPISVPVPLNTTEEYSRVPMWSQQETKDFISIRGSLEGDFNVAKRNKSLWEVVSLKMKELGYSRTPDQCKCKWKNLVTRYKGKETSDRDNTRSFPFFEELHTLFTERAINTPQTPLDREGTSSHSKKRITRTDSYQSLQEMSEDEYEDEEKNPTKFTQVNIPPRKKPEREKHTQTSDKPPTPRTLNSGNNSIREILNDFLQQQQMIDAQWRQLMEKHAYERQLLEQEWRQSMERIEMERLRSEQSWREKEEQRKTREESRAERRDALLTLLLNKLVHEQ
uniref:trihelix transcription factor GT-3b-like n=1 Tax=Erigeron canadensis TaxID=72917 RepID=UPI001CB94E1E|nr:trihelix transcription factor GT-3b-like [Erigeron canadensis]